MAISGRNIRRTNHMRQGAAGVVVESVGSEIELLVAQTDIVVEHCDACFCVVFTPVGSQHTTIVDEFSTLEEIADIVETVEVEAVGIEF